MKKFVSNRGWHYVTLTRGDIYNTRDCARVRRDTKNFTVVRLNYIKLATHRDHAVFRAIWFEVV
jgi:hypothetical protein